MQTSGLMILRVNNNGISDKKIGMQSDRPSATGFRTLAAMKNEQDRKIPKNKKVLYKICFHLCSLTGLQPDE